MEHLELSDALPKGRDCLRGHHFETFISLRLFFICSREWWLSYDETRQTQTECLYGGHYFRLSTNRWSDGWLEARIKKTWLPNKAALHAASTLESTLLDLRICDEETNDCGDVICVVYIPRARTASALRTHHSKGGNTPMENQAV